MAKLIKKEKKPLELPKDWRKKIVMRSESRKLLAKGEIKKLNCQVCFEPDSKMVHVNYDHPKNVTWLCYKHYWGFRRQQLSEAKNG